MHAGPDPKVLKEIIQTEMPFGKYSGRRIYELPAHYLEWFSGKGFPKGRIGVLLETMFVIKTEGLQELIPPLVKMYRPRWRA